MKYYHSSGLCFPHKQLVLFLCMIFNYTQMENNVLFSFCWTLNKNCSMRLLKINIIWCWEDWGWAEQLTIVCGHESYIKLFHQQVLVHNLYINGGFTYCLSVCPSHQTTKHVRLKGKLICRVQSQGLGGQWRSEGS